MWICCRGPAPAVRLLHAMFFRPESSKAKLANGRAHVMRSLVTAVISPRRFVGEASRGQTQGMDSLGALRPLPYPATKLAGCGHHIRELTCSTLPLQISAPALSLAAICDRLPTDVGMMALRTVTYIRTQLYTVDYLFVPASAVFEGCCIPTDSISAERRTKD